MCRTAVFAALCFYDRPQLLKVSQKMDASIGVNIANAACFSRSYVHIIKSTCVRTLAWPVKSLCFTFLNPSLFFSVCTMANDITRSVGQGNLFSRVPSYSPSIIIGLHSRNLTGRRLNLGVHQHLGYRLHLVWNSTKNGVTSGKAVERQFYTYKDVESFCTELTNGGSEGLCDCVGEGVIQDQAGMCIRACTLSQKGIPPDTPKSWLKSLPEGSWDKYWCRCRVKSTNIVIEWKKQNV
jgi:hypothetical protein